MIFEFLSQNLLLSRTNYKPEVQFRGSGSGVAVVVGLLLAREPGVAASVPAIAAAKPAHCSLFPGFEMTKLFVLFMVSFVLLLC